MDNIENFKLPCILNRLYAKGEITISSKLSDFIIKSSDDNDANLYIILSGKAILCHISASGNLTAVDTLISGDIVGELEYSGINTQSKSITALTKLTYLVIPKKVAKKYLDQDTEFLKYINLKISEKLLNRTDLLISIKHGKAIDRVINFILNNSENNIFYSNHAMVAEIIGVSYRYLLSTYAELIKIGFLTKIGKNTYKLTLIHNPLNRSK